MHCSILVALVEIDSSIEGCHCLLPLLELGETLSLFKICLSIVVFNLQSPIVILVGQLQRILKGMQLCSVHYQVNIVGEDLEPFAC